MVRSSSASERDARAGAGCAAVAVLRRWRRWRCWLLVFPDPDLGHDLHVTRRGLGHELAHARVPGMGSSPLTCIAIDGPGGTVSEEPAGIGQLYGAGRLIPVGVFHGPGQAAQGHGNVRLTGDGLTGPARNPGVYVVGHMSRVSRAKVIGHECRRCVRTASAVTRRVALAVRPAYPEGAGKDKIHTCIMKMIMVSPAAK